MASSFIVESSCLLLYEKFLVQVSAGDEIASYFPAAPPPGYEARDEVCTSVFCKIINSTLLYI